MRLLGSTALSGYRSSREARKRATRADPDDLPGRAEGPDNDGDECSFTITGKKALPPVSTDPDSEFAVGNKTLAAQCSRGRFQYAEAMGHAVVAGFSTGRTPNAANLLAHFLGGSGTPQDLPDGSLLSKEAKNDPQFLALDKAVQAAAKALLDGGQQTVDVSSGLHTVDFSSSSSDPDLQGAFGGTQGLDVNGSGYLQNGRYVGTITYITRDGSSFRGLVQHRFHVDDRRLVQRLQGLDQDPQSLYGHDADSVQADWIRAIRRTGAEDAGGRARGIITGPGDQHAAIGSVQPGQHDDLGAGGKIANAFGDSGFEDQPGGGRALVTLARCLCLVLQR
jgi:hypothetical protein